MFWRFLVVFGSFLRHRIFSLLCSNEHFDRHNIQALGLRANARFDILSHIPMAKNDLGQINKINAADKCNRASSWRTAEEYGRKVMEWFNKKTSIAGIQISNWIVVLGAIIVILIIYRTTHWRGRQRAGRSTAGCCMGSIRSPWRLAVLNLWVSITRTKY